MVSIKVIPFLAFIHVPLCDNTTDSYRYEFHDGFCGKAVNTPSMTASKNNGIDW